MRIAVLTPTFFEYSGIDRVVELQVKELVKNKKNKVSVVCFDGNIKVPGVQVIKIGITKSGLFSRIYRLLFFLDFPKRSKVGKMLSTYDIIHTHFYPMSVLAYDAKRRNKTVNVTEHDYGVATPALFSSFHERFYLRVFKKFSYHYMKKADRVITISHYLAGVLKDEAGIKSDVQHIKIDSHRFKKGISGERIRKKLNLGNAPVCLYVGRLSPHKGIHLLIDAYKRAKKKIPNLKLVIGGKATFGGYRDQLMAQKGDDEDIIFSGFVSDEELPEYYAAADVYTTATRWEGFDMPIPEAAACGTPTVAFDLCSHPEVTTNGILVKENDIPAFANAIVKLVKKGK